MTLTRRQEYDQTYYMANLEKRRAQKAEWYKKNRESLQNSYAAHRAARRRENASYAKRYRKENAELVKAKEKERSKTMPRILAQRKYSSQTNSNLKREVMRAYGGHCSCCGETEISFLSIDHVNNDGYKRRKAGLDGVGSNFYRQLKRDGFIPRPDLQVLCFNCNFSKRYTGKCPHEINAIQLIGRRVA